MFLCLASPWVESMFCSSLSGEATNSKSSTTKISFQNGVDHYAGTIDTEIWALAPATFLESNPNASSDADNDGGES